MMECRMTYVGTRVMGDGRRKTVLMNSELTSSRCLSDLKITQGQELKLPFYNFQKASKTRIPN